MRHDQPRFKGNVTSTGEVDAGNNRITNVGAPIAGTDAARLQDISSSQFYNTVKQTDGLASFSGIKVWNYNAEHFYISQNFPNTDEFILSLRNPDNEIIIEDTVPSKRFKSDTLIVNRNDFYLTEDSTGRPILNSTTSTPPLASPPLPTGYINGARSRFVSVDEIAVGTSGELSRVRSAFDNFNIEWFGLIEADITVAGAGGLDEGAEPTNDFLAIYAIADSTGVNVVNALLSRSFTTPLLPAGYDQFRRVGSVRNGGAVAPFDEFLDFEQRGKGREKFIFYKVDSLVPLLLFNGTATVRTQLDASTLVPPGITLMQIQISIDPNTVEGAFVVISQLGDSGNINHITHPTSGLTIKLTHGHDWIAVQDDLKLFYNVDGSGTTIVDVRVIGFLETL